MLASQRSSVMVSGFRSIYFCIFGLVCFALQSNPIKCLCFQFKMNVPNGIAFIVYLNGLFSPLYRPAIPSINIQIRIFPKLVTNWRNRIMDLLTVVTSIVIRFQCIEALVPIAIPLKRNQPIVKSNRQNQVKRIQLMKRQCFSTDTIVRR